jgi:sugar phosphate isomerase/epimerase
MDILKAYKILWNSIKNVYLSDRHGNEIGLLPGNAGWWISYLPLESFLIKLKTSGYNGFISVKVKPESLGVGNEKLVLENFENIIAYYKKHYLNYK